MNTGIFLAGLGAYLIYCVTASFMEVNYFVEMDPTIIELLKYPIVHPYFYKDLSLAN